MARIKYDAQRVSFGRSTGPSATLVVAHDKADAVNNYLLCINGELAKAWDLKTDDHVEVFYDEEQRRFELERAEEGTAGAVCFRTRDKKQKTGAIYLSAKGFMRVFGLSKSITKSCKLAPSIEGKVFCLALPAAPAK